MTTRYLRALTLALLAGAAVGLPGCSASVRTGTPTPGTTRWVVRRKAEVVSAVNGGLLSVDEACERYSLSLEEFAGWQRAVDRSGMPGLRVTRIQHYRSLYERQQKY